MGLLDEPVLFLDCQTTGRRPGFDAVIEIAWARGLDGPIVSRLVRPPEGRPLPREVARLTGLDEETLAAAAPPEVIWAELRAELVRGGAPAALVAHYARFERPFLEAWHRELGPAEPGLPPFLCTHQLARRILPRLPSGTLRGVSGHLGAPLGELRRAGEHVRATRHVWTELARRADAEGGPAGCADVAAWLGARKGKPAEPRHYLLPRERRLALPERPGLYRMKAADGSVLYVGKATSLRARVNSYFRQRASGGRIGELLAQVVDIEVSECGSALEAAVEETDLIKQLDPPYNRQLRASARGVHFFSRELEASALSPSDRFPLGPFGAAGLFEPLQRLRAAWAGEGELEWLFPELDGAGFTAGRDLFLERARACLRAGDPSAAWIAEGFRALRRGALDAEDEIAEADVDSGGAAEDDGWTPEAVARSVERTLARSAESLVRAARLCQLTESVVAWQEPGAPWRCLVWRGGELVEREELMPGVLDRGLRPARVPAWNRPRRERQGIFTVALYDRLRVLRSELRGLAGRGVPVVLQLDRGRFFRDDAARRWLGGAVRGRLTATRTSARRKPSPPRKSRADCPSGAPP